MNSQQILKSIKKIPSLKKTFRGVFARNTIPNFKVNNIKKSFGFIVNLDKDTEQGSHWIAIFVPAKKNFIEYFDSFGKKPQYQAIRSFLKKRKYFKYNNIKLQSVINTTCGQYCLFYLVCRTLNITFKKTISFFDEKNFDFNDYLVNETINTLFNSKHKVSDLRFILTQIKHIAKKYG